MTRYIKMNKRGYELVVPARLLAYTEENDFNIRVIKAPGKNPSTVQLSRGNKYIGTVKDVLGITGFKNGNPLDFRFSNVILREDIKEAK